MEKRNAASFLIFLAPCCRHLVVAAVEGEDELFLLAAAEDRLELKGRLAVPGTRLPNSIGASAGGCLWAAGGCHELVPFTVGSVNIPTTEPETKVRNPPSCRRRERTKLCGQCVTDWLQRRATNATWRQCDRAWERCRRRTFPPISTIQDFRCVSACRYRFLCCFCVKRFDYVLVLLDSGQSGAAQVGVLPRRDL